MKKRIMSSFFSALLLSSCANSENIHIEGDSYYFSEGNISIYARVFSKEKHIFDLHSPQAYRVIYYPFLYTRKNGTLKFIRYCQSMEVEGYAEMTFQEREKVIDRMQASDSIEKICNIKGLRLVPDAEAGNPMGGRGGPDNKLRLTANVFLPKTKQWERQSIELPNPPEPF